MGAMAMPLADVLDRLSIFTLKVERLPEDNLVSELLGIYEAEFEQRLKDKSKNYVKQIKTLYKQLYCANRDTWNLEYAIRIGILTEDRDLEEIGRRAIQIRDSNKRRIHIKNEISRIAAEKHGLDRKIDHGSEEL
jgi:hypothetical protein